jgi:hypothetical protein
MSQSEIHFRNLPGFFLLDGQYMSYWQCCAVCYSSLIWSPPFSKSSRTIANQYPYPQCNYANKIWDKNYAWNSKQREPCKGTTGFTGGVACNHDRCDKCYDLNPLNDKVQHCNGDKYDRLQAVVMDLPYKASTADPN